jgi:hypothetical protein
MSLTVHNPLTLLSHARQIQAPLPTCLQRFQEAESRAIQADEEFYNRCLAAYEQEFGPKRTLAGYIAGGGMGSMVIGTGFTCLAGPVSLLILPLLLGGLFSGMMGGFELGRYKTQRKDFCNSLKIKILTDRSTRLSQMIREISEVIRSPQTSTSDLQHLNSAKDFFEGNKVLIASQITVYTSERVYSSSHLPITGRVESTRYA